MKRWFVIPAALAVSVLAFGPAAQAQDVAKAVKARQALMKSNGKDAKALAAAVKKGKVGAREAAVAVALMANAKKITSLFPEGSGSDKVRTRAKPDIWQNWPKFQADAAALEKAAAAVESAAKAGDATAAGRGMKMVAAACGTCHKSFRGPKLQ